MAPIAVFVIAVVVVIVVAVVLVPMLQGSAIPVNPCPPGVCGTGGNPPAGFPFTITVPVLLTPTQFGFAMSLGTITARLNVSAPPPSGSLATSVDLWATVSLRFPNGVLSTYPAGSQSSPWATAPSANQVFNLLWWQAGVHGSYSVTVTVNGRLSGCSHPSTGLDCSVKTATGTGSFTL